MAFDPKLWLHHFVLPLVAGGDVRVQQVIGTRELQQLLTFEFGRDESAQRIAEARQAIVSELVIDPPEPELDEDALRLAAAMQNLLFLQHPGTQTVSVTRRRLRAVSSYAAQLATLALPDVDLDDDRVTARVLAARHSMLHHLFDLGRDDVRVSFWVGKREFRGAEPPPRLLKWPEVRRVREERWRVTVVGEAMSDPLMKPIITGLLASSPLTDLFEPSRLEPRFDLAPLTRWLKHPSVARAVADRWLSAGLPQVAGAYAAALMALYNEKDSRHRAAARTATAFACHVQLLSLVGRKATTEREHLLELQGIVQAQPGLRDFYGLFAAAQRVGLGRPADVARDPRLAREIDAYASACTQLVGTERLLELVGVMARGVGYQLLAS
ncbi:MAG: hypothetical protein JWN44_3198 [Myxococcales bacterium]|nr:hypothetical protein [Myxococcales bacterium]